MSLAARIGLRPSRRLAILESSFALGGLGVAAAALIARWPQWSDAVGMAFAIVACGLLLMRPRRPAATIVVSDRCEVGFMWEDTPRADDGASWRLADGTMVWPGFCVITLRSSGGQARTLPVLDHDLPGDDRRALHRFLLWATRGGAGGPDGRAADAS